MPTDPDIIEPTDFDPGGVASTPDARDYQIEDLYAASGIDAAGVFPASFKVSTMPPVLDQGSSPKCVAYSTKVVRQHQDRADQGTFFNFDQDKFFLDIGGTSNGASLRDAMARLLAFGYPIVTLGQEAQHKIAAYFAVPVAINDWKSALMAFGALDIRLDWYRSFNHPVNGVLPSPDYKIGGHATVVYGWDDGKSGFIVRNSFGTAYGEAGDCILPYSFFSKALGLEAWKSVDVIEAPPPAPVDPRVFAHVVKVSAAASLGLSIHATPHQAGKVLKHLSSGARVTTNKLLVHGEKYVVKSIPRTDWLGVIVSGKQGWIKRGWTTQIS